jgi:response regulator of citrate/malate metabolism
MSRKTRTSKDDYSTNQKIMAALNKLGKPSTFSEIAKAADMKRTTIRLYLNYLVEDAEALKRYPETYGVGRPKILYWWN